MSLGITANKDKNGALLAYIAKNIPSIHLRKLLKIVYLIDEKFMKLRGFPLTWFDYYAWEKGPVAPEVYDIKNGAFSKFVVCHKNESGSNIVESVLPSKFQVLEQMEVYSSYEMGIIDDIMLRYESMTADELSDLTHEDGSLWSLIVKENDVDFIDGKSEVLIPLNRLNAGDSEKEEVYMDAKWNMDFQAALNQYKED